MAHEKELRRSQEQANTRRKIGKRLMRGISLVIGTAAVMTLAGCGGSDNNSNSTPTTQPGGTSKSVMHCAP